jgi:hypothetical protein
MQEQREKKNSVLERNNIKISELFTVIILYFKERMSPRMNANKRKCKKTLTAKAPLRFFSVPS